MKLKDLINTITKLRLDLWGNGLLPKKELSDNKFLRNSFIALSRTNNYLRYLKSKQNEKTP